MNVLKIFGIVQVNKKSVAIALSTLALFGIATNGLFDLWKLLPTVSLVDSPDWLNIFLDISPSIIFIGWISYMYNKLSSLSTQTASSIKSSQSVTPHKGIILALSKPKKTSEEIIGKINNISTDSITSLFDEQSIGQLFKGIYHHKDELIYVWPLTTKDSAPYRECIKIFLKKFIPSAQLCGEESQRDICRIPEGDELDMIEQIKAILSHIYSNEYLEDIGLERTSIIVDITGGTKLISIGLIFGALDSAIDIQYVEQQSKKYDVIPLAITPEMILDKAGGYLIELYSKINERRKVMDSNWLKK